MPDLAPTAIDMARQGYAVFPLVHNGKTPSLAANWREISTTDLDVVSDWPEGDNIGIDTGKSGLIVVDVDVKSGPGAQTWKSLLRHRGGMADWPETLTVQTASGGYHFYFKSGDTEMRNSASLIGSWIDIRAQGGYVVGWGSVVNGREYRIIHDDPPMPIPDWLVEVEKRCRDRQTRAVAAEHSKTLSSLRMLTRPQLQAKLDALSENLAATPDGERNNMLHWTACRLGELAAADQITEEDAWDLCARAAELNGHMSWGEYGVRATFRSGFNRGLGGGK